MIFPVLLSLLAADFLRRLQQSFALDASREVIAKAFHLIPIRMNSDELYSQINSYLSGCPETIRSCKHDELSVLRRPSSQLDDPP